nr:hypothetical protein [Planococcus salinarum]
MNQQFFKKGLHGEGVNVDTATVFDGMDWEQAGNKSGTSRIRFGSCCSI